MQRCYNMVKDNNINIKLEVCRDKTSGKLTILAHFDEDAPNIIKEKGEYLWMPTLEEKDLLIEAFTLITLNSPHITSDKFQPEREAKMEVKSKPDLEPKNPEEKLEDAPSLEKPDTPSVFEKFNFKNKIEENKIEVKKIEENQQNTKIPVEDIPPKIEEQVEPEDLDAQKEIESDEINIDESRENIEMMVEADSEAIDAALKKHTEKDKSIVEVDEQTIIDKVLSQKKKGKWSKS